MMKVANVMIKSKSITHLYSSNRRMRQDGTKRRLVCNNSKQLSVMNSKKLRMLSVSFLNFTKRSLSNTRNRS